MKKENKEFLKETLKIYLFLMAITVVFALVGHFIFGLSLNGLFRYFLFMTIGLVIMVLYHIKIKNKNEKDDF